MAWHRRSSSWAATPGAGRAPRPRLLMGGAHPTQLQGASEQNEALIEREICGVPVGHGPGVVFLNQCGNDAHAVSIEAHLDLC